MNAGPVSILAGSFLAIVGFVEGADKLAPPTVPPVEILSVVVQGRDVVYERRVNSGVTIRAPYFSDMVDIATERSVPECDLAGRADYGKNEPATQVFDIDFFFAEGCSGHLVPGRSYAVVATVTPVDGLASTRRSDPFVWQP